MSRLQLFTDGATRPTNPGPSGFGCILYRDGVVQDALNGYLGDNFSNNQAEYIALIAGFELVWKNHEPRDQSLEVFSDSLLVLQQIKGAWQLRATHLHPLRTAAREAWARTELMISCKLTHIRGHQGIEGNEQADRLAGLAVIGKLPTLDHLLAHLRATA